MDIKPLILIIEDEDTICNFVSAILNANGYQVTKVSTGKEGISMAASYSPDVILLDLGLPDIDGIEVLRNIRQWSKTPIVVRIRT